MKKKILHIVEAFGGGIFSFLVDLINNTSDEYEIVVAYSIREQTPENFEKYFSNNVKFIRVENFTRAISLKKDIKAFWEIKKIIKKEKPQIIHLHSSKAGFLGRIATIGNKTKILYNPHGFSFLMQNCSKVKRFIYWLIEKIGTIKKTIIVGCSQGEYEEALKLSRNSICINNGINIKEIDSIIEENEQKENEFKKLIFCTSGRIGYQKNPKLFNEIAKQFPDNKFVWIGDGELREELTAHNIEITGWKTREEVLKLVNQSDVFILTSLWEGLPISLLEAMYLKKVCLVSNCIGNYNVIQNKVNGFICSTVEDFRKNIIEIIESRDTCKMYSENAYKDIQNEFNSKLMLNKYKKLYLKG